MTVRHGKDTAGEILRDEFDLNFESSSYFAASRVVYPAIGSRNGYASVDACFEDRHAPGMRKVWYDLITEYNTPDASRLSREIFANFPVYVGIRNRDEVLAMRQLIDWQTMMLWVDASERIPPESTDSCTLTKADADFIVENNGTLEEFQEKIRLFGHLYTAYLLQRRH